MKQQEELDLQQAGLESLKEEKIHHDKVENAHNDLREMAKLSDPSNARQNSRIKTITIWEMNKRKSRKFKKRKEKEKRDTFWLNEGKHNHNNELPSQPVTAKKHELQDLVDRA